nr:class III signal peptide-containing protein [Methanobrevibacter arboriphilus]
MAKTEFLKIELKNLKKETNGQGAAEYILLFGGVIVIAIAALMIYKSYFSNAQTNLNASNDFEDLRNAMNAT